jgi:hypothetical protein
MSKVIHFVNEDKRDGSRSIVSFEEGQERPFASRLVSQKEWFDVVAPAMRKNCLVTVVNHALNMSQWEEHIS